MTMKNIQVCKTIINQWYQDYQALHDILSSEQMALEKRDFDSLKKSNQEKEQMVAQINGHQLPSIIGSQGKVISKIQDFKQVCLSNDELYDSWSELMTLVERCNFKNEVNGRLISLLNQSSKRIFNLIKGFDPDNHIYNATGTQTKVRHFGESLSA